MKRICKYELPIRGGEKLDLELPQGASIVHVERQNDIPCMWVLFTPGTRKPFATERRRFYLVGTGDWPMPDTWEYRATWQEPPFVWHLFEEKIRT